MVIYVPPAGADEKAFQAGVYDPDGIRPANYRVPAETLDSLDVFLRFNRLGLGPLPDMYQAVDPTPRAPDKTVLPRFFVWPPARTTVTEETLAELRIELGKTRSTRWWRPSTWFD